VTLVDATLSNNLTLSSITSPPWSSDDVIALAQLWET
jgi:hypothetical protein